MFLFLPLSTQAEVKVRPGAGPGKVKSSGIEELLELLYPLFVRSCVSQGEEICGRDPEHLAVVYLADGDATGH